MGLLIAIYLALLPFLIRPGPTSGPFRDRDRARQLDCERYGAESGSERYPGIIDPSPPRTDFGDAEMVVCRERLLRPGLRKPKDEAVLQALQPLTVELATATGDARAAPEARTWLVEVHYPSAQVAAKIAFATKNALLGQGLHVSDRAPRLAFGDIDVITRMPPEQAYPAACRRYARNESLGPDEALLAVVSRDPRETILHAGTCIDGQWEWLR